MVRFSCLGHDFCALDEGALYWPDKSALIVADLHFEKASWFARSGQMLPPYDSQATIDALERAIALSGARSVWCLGDSFHDTDGVERLDPRQRERLASLCRRLDWHWITGNHDGDSAATIGGHSMIDAVLGGVALRHEARADDPMMEMSGHWHPKYRVTVRGRSISRRCFVATDRKLILPAFGSLTGGLDATHPAIMQAVGPGAAALIPVADRMLRFPLAA